MSERIDHAARAADHIVRACHPDVTKTLSHAMIAQAEATLALVEQQRIANLIAMGQFSNGDSRPPLMNIAIEAADEYRIQPVTEIREALGLS